MSEPIEAIQVAVCAHFEVSMVDLKSKRRQKTIVQARQVAMYLCRARTNHSYTEIAEAFGGRDHTTVMSAVNRVATQMENNPHLADQVVTIRLKLDRLPVGEAPVGPWPVMEVETGRTIMRTREDGVLLYAIGLSCAQAWWLKGAIGQHSSPTAGSLNKKLDWVIETAERDERWARERAAGEEPNV